MFKEPGIASPTVPVEGERRVFDGYHFARSCERIEPADAKPPWPRRGQWISDAPLTHSARVFHGWLCPDVRHIAVLDRWISMQILCRAASTHQRFSKSASNIGQPNSTNEFCRERERERDTKMYSKFRIEILNFSKSIKNVSTFFISQIQDEQMKNIHLVFWILFWIDL